MPDFDYAIIGGGFQGIIAAALLAQKEYTTCIIERSDRLGGILQGAEHNGAILDFGCHLFGNIDATVTPLLQEIMESDFHGVDVHYANITQGHKCDEVAFPSFLQWSERQQAVALFDMLKSVSAEYKTAPQNAAEYVQQRYGKTFGVELTKITHKLTQLNPETLSVSGVKKFPLSRIHFSKEEKVIRFLKENAVLDERLAAHSERNPMEFYKTAQQIYQYKNHYPSQHGMRGFCEKAKNYLIKQNVTFQLGKTLKILKQHKGEINAILENGTVVSAKNCVWTLDCGILSSLLSGENKLKDYYHKLPVVFFYFFIPTTLNPKYTYVHDFTEDHLIYRVSSPGFYDMQTTYKNQSYLCAEVPTALEKDIWKNPRKYNEKIWNEIRDTGMVDEDMPDDIYHISAPASVPLYKSGYEAIKEEVIEQQSKVLPSLTNMDEDSYGKTNMINILKEKLL